METKHSKWFLLGICAATILLNTWAVYNEYLFIPILSTGVVLLYLLLFHLDWVM